MKKDAFVIMPFSSTATCTESEWTEIFENVFKPALENCSCSCERAVPSTGSFISSIVEKLRNSWLVVADITDRNPNVFYELGVRHSLSKRTIIVCQDAEKIPSDLRGYWSLEYGIRPAQVAKFGKDIQRIVSQIESEPERSDSPVSDYLEREQLSIFGYVQKENIKKLTALFTELSGNAIAVERLRGFKNKMGGFIQGNMISTDSLGLLLQTLYVDLGPNLLRRAYELMSKLRALRWGSIRSAKLIEDTILQLEAFGRDIVSIRDRLTVGDYIEPAEVSTMVWLPSDDKDAKQSSKGSFCHELAFQPKPNLDLPETWPTNAKRNEKRARRKSR